MKKFLDTFYEMRTFIVLWLSQSFSALGSAMTSYALVIWAYNQNGSALETALLMVSVLSDVWVIPIIIIC